LLANDEFDRGHLGLIKTEVKVVDRVLEAIRDGRFGIDSIALVQSV